MRIINIIVTSDDCSTPIVSIDSFPVIEEQLSSEVAEKAQQFYVEKCVEINFGQDQGETREDLKERNAFREDAAETIDEGWMQIGTAKVCYVVSWTEDI